MIQKHGKLEINVERMLKHVYLMKTTHEKWATEIMDMGKLYTCGKCDTFKFLNLHFPKYRFISWSQ